MLRTKNPPTTSQRLSIYPEEIADIVRLPKERRVELLAEEIAMKYDERQIYNRIFEHPLKPDGSLTVEMVYNCFKDDVKYLSYEPDYEEIVVETLLIYAKIQHKIYGGYVYFI